MEDTGTVEDVEDSSRTELDSHANMPVIGMNAYILSTIGETVDVAPFTLDYKPIRVELVDAALKYDCPYSSEIKSFIKKLCNQLQDAKTQEGQGVLLYGYILCNQERWPIIMSAHLLPTFCR